MALSVSFTPFGMILPPSGCCCLSHAVVRDGSPLHFINTTSAMREVAGSEFYGLPSARHRIDGRGPSALSTPETMMCLKMQS